ncbi:hypothetical protein HG537_0A02020 [Torulaspora globosa]|uniref:Uncharacterized protein n=1 Tax=Torulaspora globosa TaxID=48254 RepID=A0A7H9HNM3_9SACH|nr:hypothetical protein HG537_0A02020 [Torulaspora sp. CBS 2947]
MVNKIKNLNSYVEEESQLYTCECLSCQIGSHYENWIPRWLIGGFLLPILWIGNVLIYVYTQWHLDHEPTHAEIPLEELPTLYEVQAKIDKTHFQISKQIAEDTDQVSETTVAIADPDCLPGDLQYYRMQFLRQTASQILESHEAKRAYYQKWTLRTLLALVAYTATIILLAMAYDTGYIN